MDDDTRDRVEKSAVEFINDPKRKGFASLIQKIEHLDKKKEELERARHNVLIGLRDIGFDKEVVDEVLRQKHLRGQEIVKRISTIFVDHAFPVQDK